MHLKGYSRKSRQVFVWLMVSYMVIMNRVIYGSCISPAAFRQPPDTRLLALRTAGRHWQAVDV